MLQKCFWKANNPLKERFAVFISAVEIQDQDTESIFRVRCCNVFNVQTTRYVSKVSYLGVTCIGSEFSHPIREVIKKKTGKKRSG